MKHYYSKSTGGFYVDAVHGTNMPADVVEISAEDHAALMHGQASGQIIRTNESGWPVLRERRREFASRAAAISAITDEIKAERDRRLQAGGYCVNDKWFHSDTLSRTQQVGLMMLGANIPPGLQWKTMDGSFVAMTPVLAQQILAAAAASDTAHFLAGETHIAALNASAEPGQYDYSSGWPAIFDR